MIIVFLAALTFIQPPCLQCLIHKTKTGVVFVFAAHINTLQLDSGQSNLIW